MQPRPLYESTHDIVKEVEIAGVLETVWECDVHKLPRSYQWDYGAFRDGNMQAVFEIKCRKKKYNTLILSLHKIMKGHDYDRVGIRAFVVIEWLDGLYYLRLPVPLGRDHCRVEWGGRKDRNDAEDMEPVVHIPVEMFTKFNV